MTIKEIEALSGMSRANIRYYEAEGFLSPERRENGYRDYSQGDLETLKRIRLLRLLGLSLADIRAAKDGAVVSWPAYWLHTYGHYATELDQLTAAIQASDPNVGD